MPEPKVIEVPWPPLALNDTGWIERLNDLAAEAEQLVGKPVTLQRTAELGMQMAGLLWPGFSPETVAASCRASALLGVPVVMSAAPADQVQEVAERLDAIYAAAQADPSAGLVELPPPMLQEVKAPVLKRGRKRLEPEDHPVDPEPITQAVETDHPVELPEPPEWEPEDHPAELAESPDPEPAPAPSEDPDDLPAAWRDCATPAPAPARPLRPLAERIAPRPAEPAPEPEPEPVALPLAAPAPRRRPAPAPARPGWFSAAEVGELLEVEPCTVARWRKEGRLGNEGTSWQQCGRGFYFCPDAVEDIDRTRIPSGLDQLVAEVQAS